MNIAEKAFMVFFFVYWAFYVGSHAYFNWYLGVSSDDEFFEVMLMFHLLGFLQIIAVYVIVFRDLYKRDFPNPNSKLTWGLLILLTSGIGLVVYLVKHGFRPRGGPVEQAQIGSRKQEDA